MLDVARHFMPVGDVLRFIDLAAFHKLNVVHLHLTDDQGWRIEVATTIHHRTPTGNTRVGLVFATPHDPTRYGTPRNAEPPQVRRHQLVPLHRPAT